MGAGASAKRYVSADGNAVNPKEIASASPEQLKREFLDDYFSSVPDHLREVARANLAAAISLTFPVDAKIAYLTDVEGHWAFFCNYIARAKGLRFAKEGVKERRTPEDLELELEEGWHFVFGGDACDNGPGTLRFLETMVRLKRKYPSRVTFIWGNRDINKIRWTSECAASELELDRVKECPAAYWAPGESPITFLQFITKLAAETENVAIDDVTDEMLSQHRTKANKYRYHQIHDMGSRGEFEFRRHELGILQKKDSKDILDNDVVESYEKSLEEGGWMREFLCLGQLGALIGSTLFVHGQIVHGTDEKDARQIIGKVPGKVPGELMQIDDVRLWLAKLNAWGADQIQQWINRPLWETPPIERTLVGFAGRGGADILAYGGPASPWPSVVYSRYLDKSCMPLPFPSGVTDYLRRNGVQYVLVGHTPHGTAPTVMRTNGVTMIMADTSFSHMNANEAYVGDNRGNVVYDIAFNGISWSVDGISKDLEIAYDTHVGNGDSLLGQFTYCCTSQKDFFIKARLLEPAYLLTHIEGFTYEHVVLSESEVKEALRVGFVRNIASQIEDLGQHDVPELSRINCMLEKLNSGKLRPIDANADGRISAGELLDWFCSRDVALALRTLFPNLDASNLFQRFSKLVINREGCLIDCAQFRDLCLESVLKDDDASGIFFPIVSCESKKVSDAPFPESLAALPMLMSETETIAADDVKVYRYELAEWKRAGRWWGIDISKVVENHQDFLKWVPTSREVWVSQLCSVSLPDPVKDQLGIPPDAVYYVWIYPCVQIVHKTLDELVDSGRFASDLAFVTIGGFGYMDQNYKLLKLLASVPRPDGKLYFGDPQPLSKDWIDSQKKLANFQPVTRSNLVEAGASYYCWIEPGAGGDPNAPDCKHGGFAYLGSQRLCCRAHVHRVLSAVSSKMGVPTVAG